MEQNKSLFEEWENGVGLGRAWWAFASAQNRKRIRELQRKGEHLGLQRSLEEDLVVRISAGELQAIGFEGGSDAGPTRIPQRYFWKTQEIDWDNETVAALGTKFYHVTVQGEREPEDEWTTQSEPVDLRLIQEKAEPAAATLQSEPAPSNEPLIQGERLSANETPPTQPVPGKLAEVHLPSKVRGRPSKTPEIEQAIEILLGKGVDLAKMPRRKAFKEIKKCAASELKSNTEIGFSDPVLQRALSNRFGRRR